MALTSPQRNLVTAWHALAADGARFDGAALAPWPAPQTDPNVITVSHWEHVSLMARGRCDGGHKTRRSGEAVFDSLGAKASGLRQSCRCQSRGFCTDIRCPLGHDRTFTFSFVAVRDQTSATTQPITVQPATTLSTTMAMLWW